MEEQALYRAILAAPHDDTPRLVYADWLQEHAEDFPESLARSERARAEFIRIQCELPRIDLEPDEDCLRAMALTNRQRRLLFTHGKKWRRAFPLTLASARFDRGFLRPMRALTPLQFVNVMQFAEFPAWLPPAVPNDSPVWRYAPDGDPTVLCPLWDVHLYASDLQGDPNADRGDYGELLARAGAHPRMARVGWLKVSFFRTPTAEFLRTGNFPNVETLVLNCGPFPEVLWAVAQNDSFRSLRYIRFGDDRWAWAGTVTGLIRLSAIWPKLDEANSRHLRHGEMRFALREILGALGPMPTQVAQPPPPSPIPLLSLGNPTRLPVEDDRPQSVLASFGCLFYLGVLLLGLAFGRSPQNQNTPYSPKLPEFKMPTLPKSEFDMNKFKFDRDLYKELLKKHTFPQDLETWKEFDARRKSGLPGLPPTFPTLPAFVDDGTRPVAPPPRPAKSDRQPPEE